MNKGTPGFDIAFEIIENAIVNKISSLNLSDLRLSEIPPNIHKLKDNLIELDLSGNRLTELPKYIDEFKKLEILKINKNWLTELPSEVCNLTELEILQVYKNQIESLPEQLGNLQSLQELKIHNNNIFRLPTTIGNLRNLRSLYVNFNQIEEIPPTISEIPRLTSILIDGNPLPDALLVTYNRGTQELLTYLKSLLDKTQKLYEAKLVLVGEGGVGKTSLVAALSGKNFIENRETTHGIEICTLDVPHPTLELDIKLNVWDFGGQTVYRITHQFFYSKRSLYLLLWSPRRGVELCDVEGWIKRIQLRIGDHARIIIVSTHAETGDRVARIDKDILKRDYGDIIVGFCDVDSKTGAGIENLRKLISSASSKLPQMGDPFSNKWKSARDKILELKKPRISFNQFLQICSSYDLDRIAAETLGDLMHDLGYIVYYGDDEGLNDEVILLPEWLTKAIGFVLEDSQTNEYCGILEHSHLKKIWLNHSFENRERYPTELHPYFLRLMEKYDVSYRLETGNKSLVTQLVPNKQPDLPWSLTDQSGKNDETHIHLICQMDEIPPGIIPWMIVRTHYFSYSPRKHWQKGMFLSYDEHGTALFELVNREIHIMVKASWPNYFMSILQFSLDRLINERWPGLEKTYSVPCPHKNKNGELCKGRFPLSTLQKLKGKMNEVPCMHCSKSSSIDKLLIGFESTIKDKYLSRIESKLEKSIEEISKLKSQNAARYRSVLRILNSETRECPHLFTISPVDKNWKDLNIGKIKLRLTLWCEMPNNQHPLCEIGSGGEGEYYFYSSKDWLLKVAPYAKFILKTLKTVVPIGGAVIKTAVDETLFNKIDEEINLAEKFVGAVTAIDSKDKKSSLQISDKFTEVEGAALREFHHLLLDIDPKRHWGGLRRILTPTGDFLWLCSEHYRQYDPGLPNLDN